MISFFVENSVETKRFLAPIKISHSGSLLIKELNAGT